VAEVRVTWVATERSSHLRGRRSKNTEPELLLRRALHSVGARFRLHRTLARGCTPDLVLPGRRLAVFVDGDYWHGCPTHNPSPPGQAGPNAALWAQKKADVAARDRRADAIAAEQGWVVVRVWECEIRADPLAAAKYVLNSAERGGVAV
jgi:DNA mismatch endonuclease, patch repair protein